MSVAARLYRPEEVADQLRVSRSTVYRLIRDGKLKSVKIGGSRRVSVEQIDDFLAEAS